MTYFHSKTLTTLLGLTIFITPLCGFDRTWIGTDGNLFISDNWSPRPYPTVNELALFLNNGASTTPFLNSSVGMTFGGIRYNATTDYTITLDQTSGITLQGLGVQNQQTIAQVFQIKNSSFMNFKNTASADVGNTGTITYNLESDSSINFSDSATAAHSTINANSSIVSFADNSSSSSATVNLTDASLNFQQTSEDAFAGVVSGTGFVNKNGPGSLNFLGNGSAFTGVTQISSGNFALNSNLGGSIVVSGSGILSGIGNALHDVRIDNGGTISPGNSIGTINIAGNYVQNPRSIYAAEINPAGQSDLINVGGTATINGGGVVVTGEPGTYSQGTEYTLLQASGGVSGTYSSLTTNLDMRSFLKYLPNSVVLAFGYPLMDLKGLDGNSLKVGNYINSFTHLGSDLLNVMEVLETLTPKELYRALDQVHGAPFEAITLTAADTAHLVTESFTDRLSFLRRSGNPCNPCTNGGAWVSGIADFVRVGKTQGLRRFNQDSQGLTLGYDHCLCDNLYLGVGGGYTHSHIRWKHSFGFINVNSGYAGAYASTFTDAYYIDAALIGFLNNNRAKRHIQFSSIERRAKSHHHSYGFNPHLGAGLFYNLCSISVIPFFELDHYFVEQNRFHEKGANDLNLHVKRNQSNLLRLETGLNFYKNYSFACGTFLPNAKVSYVGNKLLSGKRYRSSFGGSAETFSACGTNRCFNQLELGLGLTYLINDCLSINFGYDIELGKKRQEQELNLDLYYQF